jgi:hypothetical protein
MSDVIQTITLLGSIGSFLTGILMLITLIRVLTRVKFKEQVIYGAEATIKHEKIKDNLSKNAILKDLSKFEGGAATILPRLEFEKFIYNSMIMELAFKPCKYTICYIDKDRNAITYYMK